MSSGNRSKVAFIKDERHHKGWRWAKLRVSATGGIKRVRLPNGKRSSR